MFNSLDGRSHVDKGRFELPLEGLLIFAEGLQVSVKDAGYVVVDLEHLMLQSLEAIGLAIARRHRLLPATRSNSRLRHGSRTNWDTFVSVIGPSTSLLATSCGACARNVGERDRARLRAPGDSETARRAPAARRDSVCIATMALARCGGMLTLSGNRPAFRFNDALAQ